MSSNGNLLQMAFDLIWDTGEMIVNSFKKEEPKHPLEIFFNKVGLCNKDNEFPTVLKTSINKEGKTYEIECPIGLGKSDFQKYSDALEVFLGQKVEITSQKGIINIKQVNIS